MSNLESVVHSGLLLLLAIFLMSTDEMPLLTIGLASAGRMLIAGGGIDASKIGVCIAVAYACQRPQFGSRYIMEYLTHQRRLVPALATCYAMHLTLCALKVPIVFLASWSPCIRLTESRCRRLWWPGMTIDEGLQHETCLSC